MSWSSIRHLLFISAVESELAINSIGSSNAVPTAATANAFAI